MDTGTLVDDQIDCGQELIAELNQLNFDVAIASWARLTEEDRWILVIVTKAIDDKGAATAYREVHNALKALQIPWITSSDVKLVSPSSEIAHDLEDIQNSYPSLQLEPIPQTYLGNLSVDQCIILPIFDRDSPARLAYQVSYNRVNDSEVWRGATKVGRLLRGVKAKGAVAHSKAAWKVDQENSQGHESISIFLEIDPQLIKFRQWNQPAIRQELDDLARSIADNDFMRRHPDAIISHSSFK
jgi:hypothetical protein